MFVTKDPNKGLNLGKLGLAKSVPEDELTEEQKKRRTMSGEMQDPQKMKAGGQSLQLLNEPMVLLKKARPVEKWSDVFNEQHSVL
jgi:hypothetical protein